MSLALSKFSRTRGNSAQPTTRRNGPPTHRISSIRVADAACNTNGTSATKFGNANFPTTDEGRTYHLGTKRGEVANRILSVGSSQRAELLSNLLEPSVPGEKLFRCLSSRGFLTVTGKFNGTPVSIISTNMGMPNMDFVVRESRAVVDGQMAIVRLGTCGALQPPASLGNLIITQSAINIRRNPDAWSGEPGDDAPGPPPYQFTRPVVADPELVWLLSAEAGPILGPANVVRGLNATADSFYSSQGRIGGDFDDQNEELMQELRDRFPTLVSLEMETFHLLDLARCSKGGVRAAGMCFALAERYSNQMLDYGKLEELEVKGGTAALLALSKLRLEPNWTPPASNGNGRREAVLAGLPAYASLDWDPSASGSD